MDQRRKPANEINAQLAGRPVHLQGDRRVVARFACRRHPRNGRHRHPLIHNGNPIFLRHFHRHRHQPLGHPHDLVINLPRHAPDIPTGTIMQINPHRHRPNVQLLGMDHPQGLENLFRTYSHCLLLIRPCFPPRPFVNVVVTAPDHNLLSMIHSPGITPGASP